MALLNDLQRELTHARLLASVRRDGTVLESTLHDVASTTLVSLVAALFGALAESLSQGDFEPLARCVWETGKGTIVVEANGEHLLVALVEDPATIGMTRYVLRVRKDSHSESPGDHDTV